MATLGKKASFGELLLQHFIVFAFCVVFPGLVTALAPASWLTFTRPLEADPSCTIRTCVFFVVPYKTQRVDSLTSVSSREREGGVKRERKNGRDTGNLVTVDGEGFLQLHGKGDQLTEVSVSPASLGRVLKQAEDFMNSEASGSRTIFVIANWKFGAIMGGILTSFTLLWVIGYTFAFIKWICITVFRAISRFASVDGQRI